ncbi:hypothetical protein KIW84_014379 [Lathyrus oleraceus]|uniref:Uncharacterized protein n=1 Tax=Pisum sativum TaxID=3888 RepID=A0A9D5BMU2_PEA|nr:hypothetical protein KIW84_014379 [Pisum sativum]
MEFMSKESCHRTTNAERRALYDRYLKRNKAIDGDKGSFHVDDEERHRLHGSAKKSVPLISGTAYCISSCSMIMLNKIVLSSYNFNAGISLMFYQNFISTLVVVLLAHCGRVSVKKLNWRSVKVWLPVNVMFVVVLVSGMYSLKYISIAMVAILKNNDKYFNCNWRVMFIPSSFDAVGYAWQIKIMNCVLTASYSLSLRWVIHADVVKLPEFWVAATASGLIGLSISITSMWFLHQTSPTTYSLVVSLNKIPISIAGILVFKIALSVSNLFSILFGLFVDKSAILKAAELIASVCINEHMRIAFKKAGAVNRLIWLLNSNDDAIRLTATQALEALSASNVVCRFIEAKPPS